MSEQREDKGPGCWSLAIGAFFLILVAWGLFGEVEQADNPMATISADDLFDDDGNLSRDADKPDIDAAVLERAAGHAGRVVGALGASGAEQYSELCYAALAREFLAGRRDRCYAFDLFAARLLEESDGVAPLRLTLGSIRSRWRSSEARPSSVSDRDMAHRDALERLTLETDVRIIAPPPSAYPTVRPPRQDKQPDEIQPMELPVEDQSEDFADIFSDIEAGADD